MKNFACKSIGLLVLFVGSMTVGQADAAAPTWLPRYDLYMDVEPEKHQVQVKMRATWTNPCDRPTKQLVFNVHSHFVVPEEDIGVYAKTLELLRLNASEALGASVPAFQLHEVRMVMADQPAKPTDEIKPTTKEIKVPYQWVGDTNTALRVDLPFAVQKGQSVTVALDFHMELPQKQGRWGHYKDVLFLSHWLPVFAVYGNRPRKHETPPPHDEFWEPTPFVAWHQPFYNESGYYRVRATIPSCHHVACSGIVKKSEPLLDGRKELIIEAPTMRDFAFLASPRYQIHETTVDVPKRATPIRIRVLAFDEHEHYARKILQISADALQAYSEWLGPYPYPDFTIAESYFGWNGNECSSLVMIDERVFDMPHYAEGFVDYLVSHEICHQWFYNIIGTHGYSETFMDESMAVYFSHALVNRKVGKNNPLMKFPKGLRWLPNVHREDYRHFGLYGAIGRGENYPLVQDIPKFKHVANLFAMTYDKGYRVVGMIQDRLGDTAFVEFMRVIYSRYQFRILRVADFQRELEEYTGHSWKEFFDDWLYGDGLGDWAVDKVLIKDPSCVCKKRLWEKLVGKEEDEDCKADVLQSCKGKVRVVVLLSQRAEYADATVLGISLPGCEGYTLRIPLDPRSQTYHMQDPPAVFETIEPNKFRLEILLPEKPTQVSVDPDQVLVDKDPSNNHWKKKVRYRFTPIYTFLEETDLTNPYDRWNVLFGPWIFGATYQDPWYTRSIMVGGRAGVYRTQHFTGGTYAGYRTDFRDVVVGVDGTFHHFPVPRMQVGFNAERRLETFQRGDENASRGVVFARYVLQQSSSLYLPPAHFVETFATYQDNFLPFVRSRRPGGERFDSTATVGFHWSKDYLTPYWDPEGGYRAGLTYEGGVGNFEKLQGIHKMSGQLSFVKSLPDFSGTLASVPGVGEASQPLLRWVGNTRVAVRVFGAVGLPLRGEFFSLGGGHLFRGYDQAERQGSAIWIASVEWRVPLARDLDYAFLDHTMNIRNVHAALFYDVGDAYTGGGTMGPVSHGVGAGLRIDIAWLSLIERTSVRLDVAQAVGQDTPVQFWVGLSHPF